MPSLVAHRVFLRVVSIIENARSKATIVAALTCCHIVTSKEAMPCITSFLWRVMIRGRLNPLGDAAVGTCLPRGRSAYPDLFTIDLEIMSGRTLKQSWTCEQQSAATQRMFTDAECHHSNDLFSNQEAAGVRRPAPCTCCGLFNTSAFHTGRKRALSSFAQHEGYLSKVIHWN